jgi:hypothetical protein
MDCVGKLAPKLGLWVVPASGGVACWIMVSRGLQIYLVSFRGVNVFRESLTSLIHPQRDVFVGNFTIFSSSYLYS